MLPLAGLCREQGRIEQYVQIRRLSRQVQNSMMTMTMTHWEECAPWSQSPPWCTSHRTYHVQTHLLGRRRYSWPWWSSAGRQWWAVEACFGCTRLRHLPVQRRLLSSAWRGRHRPWPSPWLQCLEGIDSCLQCGSTSRLAPCDLRRWSWTDRRGRDILCMSLQTMQAPSGGCRRDTPL